MMVSRKVFCGATCPLRTGIFAAAAPPPKTLRDFGGLLKVFAPTLCSPLPAARAHDAHCADRLGGGNPGAKVCPSCSGIRRLLVDRRERLRRVLETRRAVCCARRIWAVSSFHFPGFEERSEGVRPFLSSPLSPSLPRGRAACQVMFPPVVSHSAEHSGPLILHYSPLLSSGSGEPPDERRWSHSLWRGRRALLFFLGGGG